MQESSLSQLQTRTVSISHSTQGNIREISERERDIDRCLVLEQFSPGELPQPEQPLEAEDSQLCRLDFSDLEPSDSWPLSPLDRELEGRQ